LNTLLVESYQQLRSPLLLAKPAGKGELKGIGEIVREKRVYWKEREEE
jgi:hypothetical protein